MRRLRYRALAYHAPPLHSSQPPAGRLENKVRSVFSRAGESVWTRRVVLPLGRWGERLEALEKLESTFRRAGGQYLAVPIPLKELPRLRDLLSVSDGIFVGVEVPEPDPSLAPRLVEALEKVYREMGPAHLTRLAFGLGGLVETAYFPATRSAGEGVSLSLLHVGDLVEAAREGSWGSVASRIRESVAEAEGFGRVVAEAVGGAFRGVDPSISPWMEESVAELVETLSGSEFGGPGTYEAIWRLNSELAGLGGRHAVCGFSEVMLPVAEDNRLKELVADGRLRLRDLVGLSMVCAAGVDMVAIPLAQGRDVLRAVADILSAAAAKGRPFGLRLILAEGRPGDWVELDRFGSVPIARL